MTINYAQKYEKFVDEKFRTEALTSSISAQNFDWADVDTVKIYSIDTVELVDYTRVGASRYGNPDELGDSIQTMTLSQDKAFTYTIDRASEISQAGQKNAGESLKRQIAEVIVPAVDIYRIQKLAEGAGTTEVSATTKSNAYEQFLSANEVLSDNKVPLANRIALITPSYYKFLKLDDTFIKSCDLAQDMLLKGQVGMVDGVPVIIAPSSYFPENVNFIVLHNSAMTAPVKLSEYKVHENPPGISGSLVEGRIIHDAFILNNKKMAIYVHKTQA